MRVVVAADACGPSLPAVAAAARVRDGWLRRWPTDSVAAFPLSTGADGFIDVIHSLLGGEMRVVTVAGPSGSPVPATMLMATEPGGDAPTAFVEPVQVTGPDLLRQGPMPADSLRQPDPRAARSTSAGVGELIAAANDTGVTRIVVGLGAVGALDGGAGMLAALGAAASPADALRGGAAGLATVDSVDLDPAVARVAGTPLVLLTDEDTPLLGLRGVTNRHGAAHGLDNERRFEVDGWLSLLAHVAGREVADVPGAGAGGGIGYGLLLLGAQRVPGLATTMDLAGARQAIGDADLVLVVTGHLGPHQIDGGVVGGVAQLCGDLARPCVAVSLTGDVSPREHRAAGMDASYCGVDGGEGAVDFGTEGETLERVAQRVARTWGRR